MKKKSWNKVKSFRCKTKRLQKWLKFLKRQRNKRARKRKTPELEYQKTGAWDII